MSEAEYFCGCEGRYCANCNPEVVELRKERDGLQAKLAVARHELTLLSVFATRMSKPDYKNIVETMRQMATEALGRLGRQP